MSELESAWSIEMADVRKKRRWFYKTPFPKKRQIFSAYKEENGKVKVYSKEEILLYQLGQLRSKIKRS